MSNLAQPETYWQPRHSHHAEFDSKEKLKYQESLNVPQKYTVAQEMHEVLQAPGLVFTENDAVIPDLVWASNERLANGMDNSGHFVVAPELIVEVLSADIENEQRDKTAKLKLYSRYGVQEYWIANWRLKSIEVYQRQDAQLQQVKVLFMGDTLTSPLFPEFECSIGGLFIQ